MKLKEIWVIMQMFTIALTSFFALYIPSMYLNHRLFLEYVSADFVFGSIVVFFITTFGCLFICLAISGKVIYWFNETFEWDKSFSHR